MRGIDTNLLVRYVTRDEPEQARRVRDLFDRAATSGERLHVSVIVLCELVWVLRSGYGQSRERICDVLAALLETPELVVEDADAARRAVEDYADGRAGFADALMARRNRRAGCRTTLTFDRRLQRCDSFEVL